MSFIIIFVCLQKKTQIKNKTKPNSQKIMKPNRDENIEPSSSSALVPINNEILPINSEIVQNDVDDDNNQIVEKVLQTLFFA